MLPHDSRRGLGRLSGALRARPSPWRRGWLPNWLKSGWALAWVAPCSLVGLVLALPWWWRVARGQGVVQRVGRTLELAWQHDQASTPVGPATDRSATCWPFAAITLGHVVLGTCPAELARLRVHEAVHVRQYERWGLLFWLAYPLASVWSWMAGQGLYRGNRFERAAFEAERGQA